MFIRCDLLISSLVRITSAHTTRREQEPVHEDALAVVVRIVRQQSVPFILLFAATVAAAPIRARFPMEKPVNLCRSTKNHEIHLRAHFLMDRLLEMLSINNRPDLSS